MMKLSEVLIDIFRMELLEHLRMNMVKMTASHVFPVFRHV